VLIDDAVECFSAEAAIRCATSLARRGTAFSWADHEGGPLVLCFGELSD